jgi:hypothetical protein
MKEHRGESNFEHEKHSIRQNAQERYEQSVKRGENKRRIHNKIYPGAQELKSLYTSKGFLEEEDKIEKKTIRIRIVNRKTTPVVQERQSEPGSAPVMSGQDTCVYSVLRSQLDELNRIKDMIEVSKNELKMLKIQIKRHRKIRAGVTTQDLWNYCSALQDVSKGKFDDSDK